MHPITCRLRLLISSPSSSRIRIQARSLFSSFSDEPSCRSRSLFFDDPGEPGTGSLVYRHTLKTQRPSTIRWQKELTNSASFIGRVYTPVKTFTTRDGKLVANTLLRVESPSDSKKFLTILLTMWEDMAELSIQHLKQNDCIYVSGYLGSFTKASNNGDIILRHKVTVKEINYVANNDQTASKNKEDPEESPLEKQRKRLHLWQVFFASPHEWKDLRKRKTNPRQPDFMHKGTREALWLNPFDPPWIMRQLQLQDSRMGGMGLGEHLSNRSSLSPLSYESD
ncbi:protein OSB1, mitochondrial [Cynara cardunculus var. scolymus]|uniref:Nucleic acid-binding, OB-fold n=1 Tax=Cynara cardunculus var. scolymus TaxID=59895 RepID=A0A103XWT0_CYNCS|nr:protein OSB1, mitochondrial [Cynara cardunculus var. scolymus]KVH98343.1 Nucleic acid-binding, OB-fold [Cynara cardunculus var. scolymus]